MSDIPSVAVPNFPSSTVWVKRSDPIEGRDIASGGAAPASAPSTTAIQSPAKSVSSSCNDDNHSAHSAVSIESVSCGANVIQLGNRDSHPGVEIGVIENAKMHFEKQRSIQTLRTHKPYAYTAPKILLETISARGVLIVLVLTYLTFIVTFSWDASVTIFRNSGAQSLTALPCSVNTEDLIYSGVALGCMESQTEDTAMWLGYVTYLENIVALGVDLEIGNVTKAEFESQWINKRVLFSVFLAACSSSTACDNWEHVLKVKNDVEPLRNHYLSQEDRLLIPLVGNMYQNQETIPTRGYVEAYRLYINFTFYESDPSSPTSFEELSLSNSEILVHMDTLSRKSVTTTDALTVIMLFITIVLIGVYSHYMIEHVKAGKSLLPEQKWIFFYLIALVLFQNPVYCVICWQKDPDTTAVFASYILDGLSQSVIFVLWLMFADGKYREQLGWKFYLPKIAIGAVIFVSIIVVYVYQFPSMSRFVDREPLLAVYNWSSGTKQGLTAASMFYILAILVWFTWWFIELYRTGSYLRKIRYMDSRFLQLSFRFFLLQATLVAMFYLLQYLTILYFILNNSRDNWETDLTGTADNINTLFRQQTQLFGKVFFLTMYGVLLSFFFLPAGSMQFSAHAIVSATFVLSESEVPEMRRSRRRAIRRLQALGNLSDAKVDVYCVDTAIQLAGLSYEAYRDPPGAPRTPSGFGTMDLARHGYTLVDMKYNAAFDAHVYICRNIKTNRMVVMFRGTATMKNWNSNLKYAKKPVDFFNMRMLALDVIDGLGVKEKDSLVSNMEDDNNSDASSESSEGEDSKGASVFAWLNEDKNSSSSHPRPWATGASSSARAKHRPTPDPAPGTPSETNQKRSPNIFKFQRIMSWRTQRDNNERAPQKRSGGSESTYAPSMVAHKQRSSGSMGGITEMVKKAASKTPGLRRAFNTYVHMGFWESYLSVREFVHAVLRRELSVTPGEVYFTGHSLGGALATLAALDFVINSQPRINYYLHAKYWVKLQENSQEGGAATPRFQPIRTSMYNIGSPRVGNRAFANLFNQKIPNAFLTVVDGDLVTGVPPKSAGYKHVGTRVDIDGEGSGNLIVDPSFVEKRFTTSNKNSVFAHMLSSYCLALRAVKLSLEMSRDSVAKERQESRWSIGEVFSSMLRAEVMVVDDKSDLMEYQPPSSDLVDGGSQKSHPYSASIRANDELIGDIIDELNESDRVLSGDALQAKNVVGALGQNKDSSFRSDWDCFGLCSRYCSSCSDWFGGGADDDYQRHDDSKDVMSLSSKSSSRV